MTGVPSTQKRGSVYFVSHGGPPSMFMTESPAYKAWQTVGKLLTESRPKGIVTVSAHWENPEQSSDVIVNKDFSNPLIYDFYGFPKHFYSQTFESTGNDQQLADVKAALKSGGLNATEEKRGLDHGVWIPFKVAFDGRTDIPIVQVSLPGDSSVESSIKLGRALSSLRDQGYAIVGTGQVVHNLRDVFGGRPTPYADPFLNAVKTAISDKDAMDAIAKLTKHPLYKQAHPTDEHFLPLPVALAATDKRDKVEPIYVGNETGLGWGLWRWQSTEA